jgi:Tripartite tricarboxylate transporter TctB family
MSRDASPDPAADARAQPDRARLQIGNPRDFLAGLLFIAIGVATAIGASDYPLGTIRNIGAGYYPILIGIVLALLGAAIALQGLKSAPAPEPVADDGSFAPRPLFFVIAAVVTFGLLVRPFGLAAAIVALIVISSFAGRDISVVRIVVLCIGMVAASWLVFIWLLGLNMSLWPR